MSVKILNSFLSKECLRDSKSIKLINAPKGKINSRKAFSLSQRIDNTLNRENAKNSFGRQYIKK